MCSLIANGLLTFVQKGYQYEEFFDDKKHVVYFENVEDLIIKIKYYSKSFNDRSSIGYNGKKRYFDLFENSTVTKYMIEKFLKLKILIKKYG